MTIKCIKPGTNAKRAVQFDEKTINVEARTVELSFSSEEPALRHSFFGDSFFEVLDHSEGSVNLGRFENGAPLLIDHDNSIKSQIGIIEAVSIDSDRKGRVIVRFGKSAADEEIFQKVQDGIVRNVSVGYRVHDSILDQQRIDGLDVVRVTNWEPMEVSLVSVPLDSSVGIGRSASIETINFQEQPKMKEEIKEVDNTDQIRKAGEEAAQRAATAERKRVSDIMTIGKDHPGGADLAMKAIADGDSVQKFQNDLLGKLREAEKKPVAEPTAKAFDGAKVEENADKDPKCGFKSFGDFAKFTRGAAINREYPEHDHIRAAASTWASIATGTDNGFSIPPEFSTEIARIALEETSLLSLISPTPIDGNSMTYPKSEATPWGSTGVQAYWEGEASEFTQSKPIYKKSQLDLHKLTALVPVTEELLEDSSAMSVEVPRDMGTAIDWKVQDSIMNGNGAGMPLGIMNAPSTVSQAKTTSQTAATVTAANVAKMLGRLLKGPGNVAWLANPDVLNQLYTMTLGDQPIWTAPTQGFQTAPNGLLLGRPIIETEACQTLGTVGDLVLVNFGGFRAITKSGGMQLSQSMDLWFDQDLVAFKLRFRLDAQPILEAPVTPPNSSVTRSHFVTLATRA